MVRAETAFARIVRKAAELGALVAMALAEMEPKLMAEILNTDAE